jgi:hypothetical protein
MINEQSSAINESLKLKKYPGLPAGMNLEKSPQSGRQLFILRRVYKYVLVPR